MVSQRHGASAQSVLRDKKNSQIDGLQSVGVDMEVVEWWHGHVDVWKTCSEVGVGVLLPESSE